MGLVSMPCEVKRLNKHVSRLNFFVAYVVKVTIKLINIGLNISRQFENIEPKSLTN